MSEAGTAVHFHAGDGCPSTIDRAKLAREFARLAPHFPKPLARVDALLLGDSAMDAAHRRYSQVEGTTDVLSFPAETGPEVEVDLMICVDVALREAAARGHGVDREILLYAVHGALHACGYRDDTDASAAAIHAEEDRILSAGGGGVVYARNVAGPSEQRAATEAGLPPAFGSVAPEGPNA